MIEEHERKCTLKDGGEGDRGGPANKKGKIKNGVTAEELKSSGTGLKGTQIPYILTTSLMPIASIRDIATVSLCHCNP